MCACRGSGTIGVVQALREQGYQAPITIISHEPLPFDRTKLSKALIADASKLQLRPQDWYDEASIATVHDEVSSVDFSTKEISTASGNAFPYSKLILATGGKPKALPLPGFKDLGNVFLLRSIPDVQQILAAAGENKDKNVVVVGSSFIGMEVANAISSKVASVTVVGQESAPLERVMGAEVGKIFQRTLSNNGIKFHMNAGVEKASPSTKDSKSVGAVHLKDGTELPADFVILGVGVSPATQFLSESKSAPSLEKDGSLKTDESFAVSGLKDVYAIGDIATYPYHGPGGNGSLVRIEHWNVAQNAGRSVAASIAKSKKAKPFIPIFWSALGSQLRYCGNTPNGWDDLVLQGKPDEGKFAAFYGNKGETVAVASMMMDPVMSKSAELMRRGKMPGLEELRGGKDVLEVELPAEVKL